MWYYGLICGESLVGVVGYGEVSFLFFVGEFVSGVVLVKVIVVGVGVGGWDDDELMGGDYGG